MHATVVSVGATARVLGRDERDALLASPEEYRSSLDARGLSGEEVERHLLDAETRLSIDLTWWAVLADGRRIRSQPRHGRAGLHVDGFEDVDDAEMAAMVRRFAAEFESARDRWITLVRALAEAGVEADADALDRLPLEVVIQRWPRSQPGRSHSTIPLRHGRGAPLSVRLLRRTPRWPRLAATLALGRVEGTRTRRGR